MSSGPKLVVVGDGAVGKTCLLVVYVKKEFPKKYVPTVFDNYTSKVRIRDTTYHVQLWDTAGQEELENIRTLSYANTSVFLVCFSVIDPNSFDNIETIWLPELNRFSKNPTIMLVGTKTDLRNDPATLDQLREKGLKPISTEAGRAKARALGAIDYIECSAITNENVDTVFDTAISYTVNPPSKGCCIIE